MKIAKSFMVTEMGKISDLEKKGGVLVYRKKFKVIDLEKPIKKYVRK